MQNRHVRSLLFALLGLALLAGPLLADDEPAPQPLAEKLRSTIVSVQVDGMRFVEVVDLLKAQTGINILIDPRIKSDVEDNPVTSLQVSDLDLATVLDLLQGAGGESIIWAVQENVVVITMRELLPVRLDVRIYPVADLVSPRRAFLPLSTGLLGGTAQPDEQDPVLRYGGADELIELVQCAVSPCFWEETEGAGIRTLGDERLVVRATPEIHEAVLAFLTRLENRGPDALRVEVHVLDGATLPREVAGLGSGAAFDDATAVALLGGRDAGACPSFTLAVRDGVTSSAFVGTRRTFVSAYEPHFAGGTSTPDPEIDVQELGLAIRVCAMAGDDDDGRILLKLGVAAATAADSQPSEAPDSASLELPGLVRTQRESTLPLTPGRWHLAEGTTGGEGDGSTVFLVRVTPWEGAADARPAATPFLVPTAALLGAGLGLPDVNINRVHWEAANLDQVVSHLRTMSGLNFYVTPRVRAEVFEDVEISLELADLSLRTVLDLVTAPFELRWTLKDNLVVIDRKDAPIREMTLRYYDLKDLTVRIVRGMDSHHTADDHAEPAPLYSPDELVDLIRETIGGYDAWRDSATIESRNSILIVRNESHIQDAVALLLEGLRASVGIVVTTVDHVVLQGDALRALDAGEPGGGSPWLLERAPLAAIDEAIGSGSARRLGRERIISVHGSATPKVTGQEIRYVAEYDVESKDVSVPVRRVDTLRSGTSIRLRATPGPLGSTVYLELESERSVLSAMQPFATPHGPIDLPICDVWRVATGMRVPDGRTAVVSAHRAKDGLHLLLVTPRRID